MDVATVRPPRLSIRRDADGIGAPNRTLGGWVRGRYGNASEHGNAFVSTLTALRGHLDAAKQHLAALLETSMP